MERQRVTAIVIGKNQEVAMEELLMKLGLLEPVMKQMAAYIAAVEGDSDCDTLRAPDPWAIKGAFQNLSEVSHALKSACWGHEEAHKH
jgi:hypothetical protein